MISLHYTSHTKAYNTYYAQCDIVEQSTPLHICYGLLGLYMKAVSRRSFSIIWMHVSSRTTRRLSGCVIITIKVSLSLYTVCSRSAVTSRNLRYIDFDFCVTN